jgi:hypothetical protein
MGRGDPKGLRGDGQVAGAVSLAGWAIWAPHERQTPISIFSAASGRSPFDTAHGRGSYHHDSGGGRHPVAEQHVAWPDARSRGELVDQVDVGGAGGGAGTRPDRGGGESGAAAHIEVGEREPRRDRSRPLAGRRGGGPLIRESLTANIWPPSQIYLRLPPRKAHGPTGRVLRHAPCCGRLRGLVPRNLNLSVGARHGSSSRGRRRGQGAGQA